MQLQSLVPPQWYPLHTLGPSSTTPLHPLGDLQEGFPTSPCILDVGLHGNCWWAIPQPRDLSRRVINTRILYSGTAQTIKEEYCLAFGQSLWLTVQRTLQGCGAKRESTAYLVQKWEGRGGVQPKKRDFFKWSQNHFWVVKSTLLNADMISWKLCKRKMTRTPPLGASNFLFV